MAKKPNQGQPQGTAPSPKQVEEWLVGRAKEMGLEEEGAYGNVVASMMQLFAPMYQRKPVVAPLDMEVFQNPMWSNLMRETELASDREKMLKDYADMDEDPIITAALDIYSSESCQYSDEHDATVWVTSQDPIVMEESYKLFQNIALEEIVEGIARDTAKCGEDFVGPLYNFRDGVVALRFVDPEEVRVKVDRYGRLTGYSYKDSKKELAPWDFVHFKNIGRKKSVKKGGAVYGQSLIEPARKVWRQLRLMEDALMIWRMDIGTRRLVFYVDVGNLGMEEAMKVVRQWERAYKKKMFYNPQTGEFISRHSPLAMDNHIFWPIRPNSRSRVEYIGGDANVTAVADIDYFRRKLATSLKIPIAYLGGDEYSSVRSGLAQMDVYFARIVKKLQRAVMQGVTKLLLTHLRLREVRYDPNDVRINMEPVSGIEEMQRVEALTAAVNLAQNMFVVMTTMGVPPQYCVPYILKDVLRLADEDLMDMPIDPAQIQAVQDQQRDQQQQADDGGDGDDGDGGDGGPPHKEDRKEVRARIQEELRKPGYDTLRRYLASHSDASEELLVAPSELPTGRGDSPDIMLNEEND